MEYRPLSSLRNEIRLLEIDPAEILTDRIQCRLQHESLYAIHEYVALSYRWGDESLRQDVIVSGNIVSITVSLANALQQLRRRGCLRVWADALCINQKNKEERSQQVLMMSAIYRSASRVVACIGCEQNDDGQATVATQFLLRLGESRQGNKSQLQIPRSPKNLLARLRGRRLAQRQKQSILDGAGNAPRTKVVIKEDERAALLTLLGSQYWLRMWIIQELAVNPRLEILWGGHEFVLDDIVDMLREVSGPSGKSISHDHIRQLLEIRKGQLARQPLAFFDALCATHHAKSSDKRDKLYAILGLTYDGPSIVPFPNYFLPRKIISLDTTKRFISTTGSLGILFPKTSALGVWFPDCFDPTRWADPRVSQFLGNDLGADNSDDALEQHVSQWYIDKMQRCGGRRYPSFSACGEHQAGVDFEHGIILKGSIVDCVKSCSPTMDEARLLSNNREEKGLFHPGFEDVGKATKSFPSWLFTKLDLTTFTRRRISDWDSFHLARCEMPYRLLSHDPKYALQFAPSLMQWFSCCTDASFQVRGVEVQNWFSKKLSRIWSQSRRDRYLIGTGSRRELAPYLISTLLNCIQRNVLTGMRFGETEGGCLGWLHGDAVVGDVIAIVRGSRVPVILREQPTGGYLLVGESIIDGLMFGEALEKFELKDSLHVLGTSGSDSDTDSL